MDFDYLLIEKIGNIQIIRLNEPNKRNALVIEMRKELFRAFSQAEQDEDIKTIILTGEGKAFSAGGDLSTIRKSKPLETIKRLQSSHPLIMKMVEMEKPIIAAVNGAAAGAGFSLALLCDVIFASEQAFFVQSFVNIGLIPDFAAMHFLPMLVGPHKAKELMFMGERISAEEAHRIGIVNRVVPVETLLAEAIEFAEKLAKKPPISVGMTKKIMNQHINRDLKVLLELEAQGQDLCSQTEDFKEGVNAFFEKREPNFLGK
ncbi:Enoyl-CoA hydratase/isomerase [Neobacillus bataviensis LMG 21833]|uniref:Enoyl-CoA hydratase/isomerase n=1 Tax=Neobacillus bataviensis LMG 21833 TaxID=1117379 RepID=K6D369_9BACI|nr:enoyl-CoA hydratase-related protein [Neobacillus bataviensis]EKN66952.1 Enoyl-CoA hydratase/isomerase [Neobacillus bataviensis LMG 21833]